METPYCDPLCHFTSVSATFTSEFHFQFVIYSSPSKCNHCVSVALRISAGWDLTKQNESNNRGAWVISKLKSIRLENNLPERWKVTWVQSQTCGWFSTRPLLNEICVRFIILFFFFENCWCLHLKTWSSFVFTNKSLKFSFKLLSLVCFIYKNVYVELHWIWQYPYTDTMSIVWRM